MFNDYDTARVLVRDRQRAIHADAARSRLARRVRRAGKAQRATLAAASVHALPQPTSRPVPGEREVA